MPWADYSGERGKLVGGGGEGEEILHYYYYAKIATSLLQLWIIT